MDLRSALLCVGGSVCSFKLVHTLLGGLQAPPREGHRAWRQRNIGTSLAHSSLSGAWAALCFWCHPQMAEDLISTHTRFSFSLVTLSTGYFIYDALDLLLNQSFKRSWEVLLHHAVVVSCFSLAISSRLYVGFAVLSLLVEINTVFLHIRQLMLLSGWRNRPAGGSAPTTDPPRPTPAFRLTSLLNLATFLVFRLCTLGWMTRWLAAQAGQIPQFAHTLGTVGLGGITVMNVVLLYRLLRAEVLTDTRTSGKDH
ncbi:TLC domain-containing protein 2-like [Gadus chalcogrammus]|uniref:TLC domain-containing protein 2-like n=1 Tax=Gadus chalcogrammus TaxID=1042646 RepID=UPI0024C3F4D2|nr:TLC domain-containing protein 2-like [Gadus chalcogrammus]XP_056451033.1 TLC domain-containing protein 2-like [Gadus chalcogrammus]XP_056451034.1 TLC domain-containing protein 2-like [Gadus chalcogrammus]